MPALAGDGVDLIGTWHVLVHYRDDHTAHPDLERWEDKMSAFARSGCRLRWTQYPIVVFTDESGFFERRSTGQYARVLHAWEPNEKQLDGDPQGARVQHARLEVDYAATAPTPTAWASQRRSGAVSASVITYTEVWIFEALPAQPVLTLDRRDGLRAHREHRGSHEVLYGRGRRPGATF